jgi:prophage maintenance system killer protein
MVIKEPVFITQLFLHLNGYDFSYPEDSYDYILAIAANENKDIRKIAKWIKENCAKGNNNQSHP